MLEFVLLPSRIAVFWIAVLMTSLNGGLADTGFQCYEQGFADCQEVAISECQKALSGPHSDPRGLQLHANMAAAFLNLTVMSDSSTPGTQTKLLRAVLTNRLGYGGVRLSEMLVLMASTDKSTPWVSCGRIQLAWLTGNAQESSLTALLPLHPNVTSYRMSVVSTYRDEGGQLDTGHAHFLIKMADFSSVQDWILPVIAYREIQDRVVLSITPPSPRLHRNMLKCDTWLITCGRRRKHILVPQEGIDPEPASKSTGQESGGWGLEDCVYYMNETSLKSPIVNMKVEKRDYQIWIDCVIQNPMTSWPSTKKTIRTPTFSHSGKDEFFIVIQWEKESHRPELLPSRYLRHSLYPNTNPAIPETITSPARDDNDKLVIVTGCLLGIGPLIVGIGVFVVYKAKTRKRRHHFFREDSCDERAKSLPASTDPAPSPKCPHACLIVGSKHRVPSTDDSVTTCYIQEEGETTEDGVWRTDTDTPSLLHTSCDVINTHSHAHSTDTHVDLENGDDDKDEGVDNTHDAGDNYDYNDDGDDNDSDILNSEVISLQIISSHSQSDTSVSVPISRICDDNDRQNVSYDEYANHRSKTKNNRDRDKDVIVTDGSFQKEAVSRTHPYPTGRYSPEDNSKYLSTIGDNSSSLGYYSYNPQLSPIKQPKFLTADVRTDSLYFNDFLQSFNSTTTDWRGSGLRSEESSKWTGI